MTNAGLPPIRVGLVGTGPWAEKAYAPMLAAGPETRLVAVYSPRPEAARSLALAHGAVAMESFEDLLTRCEAVAFAVPPDIQAELAVRAAQAGKALLLDKPLAFTVGDAERLANAVQDSGVVTQLMLTHRYRTRTADFLVEGRAWGAIGARLAFLSGAFIRGSYACAWRKEHGALHDLGPHAFDLLEAAMGPIESMTGRGDPRRFVSLACRHEGGTVSDVSLSGVVPLSPSIFRLELYGPGGALEFDAVAASAEDPWPQVRRSFAAAFHAGRAPALDVHRGLRLQRLIEMALRSLD